MTYEEAVESFLDLWKEKGFRLVMHECIPKLEKLLKKYEQ